MDIAPALKTLSAYPVKQAGQRVAEPAIKSACCGKEFIKRYCRKYRMIKFKVRKSLIPGDKAVCKSSTASGIADDINRASERLNLKSREKYIIKPTDNPDSYSQQQKGKYEYNHKKSMAQAKVPPGESQPQCLKQGPVVKIHFYNSFF